MVVWVAPIKAYVRIIVNVRAMPPPPLCDLRVPVSRARSSPMAMPGVVVAFPMIQVAGCDYNAHTCQTHTCCNLQY